VSDLACLDESTKALQETNPEGENGKHETDRVVRRVAAGAGIRDNLCPQRSILEDVSICVHTGGEVHVKKDFRHRGEDVGHESTREGGPIHWSDENVANRDQQRVPLEPIIPTRHPVPR